MTLEQLTDLVATTWRDLLVLLPMLDTAPERLHLAVLGSPTECHSKPHRGRGYDQVSTQSLSGEAELLHVIKLRGDHPSAP